jgi:hypothetical protein
MSLPLKPKALRNSVQVSEIEIMVVLRGERHHIPQRSYTFRINRYRMMTLTYRGVKYDQASGSRDQSELVEPSPSPLALPEVP